MHNTQQVKMSRFVAQFSQVFTIYLRQLNLVSTNLKTKNNEKNFPINYILFWCNKLFVCTKWKHSRHNKNQRTTGKIFPSFGEGHHFFYRCKFQFIFFLFEKNGEEIFNDEVSLSAGDNYVIDLSSYPAGTYRVIIRDIIYCKEYDYFFTKQDENTELF